MRTLKGMAEIRVSEASAGENGAGRDQLGQIPAFLIIDVGGFHPWGFKQNGLASDARVGGRKALPGEEVEVGVLLVPRFEVLGPDEVVRIVVDGGAVAPVEAGLELVDREEGVLAGSPRPIEGPQRPHNGGGTQERVGGVGHQVGGGRNGLDVIGQHLVHADEIPTDLGLAVADEDAVRIHEAVVGKDGPGVGVDDDLLDLRDCQKGIENPPEQGLAGEVAEVLPLHPGAVGLHGEEGDELVHRNWVSGFGRQASGHLEHRARRGVAGRLGHFWAPDA